MQHGQSLAGILSGRTFCARVNKKTRLPFIKLAEMWISKHCKSGEKFCSDNLQGIARQHGYSKSAPRNALLTLEARSKITRDGTKRIPDAKRPGIVYKVKD